MGAGSDGRNPSTIASRERAFQKYFDTLCDNRDVTRTQCLQAALAVAVPEPISHLRVRGWLRAPGGQGLSALLDMRPEGQVPGSGAVAEAYHVVASLVFRDDLVGEHEELCPVADFRVPAVGTATQARVECLKPGAQVELQVSASNAVGQSTPVSIRVVVPATPGSPASMAASGDLWEHGEGEATVHPSSNCGQGASSSSRQPLSNGEAAVHPSGNCGQRASSSSRQPSFNGEASLAAREATLESEELARRKQELEREWAERRRETERADAELRERMAAFRMQREELERQREAFDMQRMQTGLSCIASEGICSPAQEISPLPTPRDCCAMGEEFEAERAKQEAERAELDRRSSELRAWEAEREVAVERSAAAQRAEREALEREREELQRQAAQLRAAEAAAEAACAARGGELEELQAQLARRREEAQGNLTASVEAQERAARVEDLLVAQAELDARKAELCREQALHEEARRNQADELREAEAELLRRAERLARMEETLNWERQDLSRSRASLAVVQAHVVSLLDRAMPNVHGAATHRLDADLDEDPGILAGETAANGTPSGEREAEATPVDGVWTMDWAAACFPDHSPERRETAPDD